MPGHPGFGTIGRHFHPADPARVVLAAGGALGYTVMSNGPQGTQHIHLLAPHVIRIVGHRRLHRHQAQQLQQVVLHHVPQRAGVLVVAAAVFNPQGLGHRDCDVVHVAAVPHRLVDGVGETHGKDVLDRFLAQEVIDAIDL